MLVHLLLRLSNHLGLGQENIMLANGSAVKPLKTPSASMDFVLKLQKPVPITEFAVDSLETQRIWCLDSGIGVPVTGFRVETLDTCCLSADLVLKR